MNLFRFCGLLPLLLLAGCGDPTPATVAEARVPTPALPASPAGDPPASPGPAPVESGGNESPFTTIPDAAPAPRATIAGVITASGTSVPAPANQERRDDTFFRETDPLEEARQKREAIWAKMARLAEQQWKLEGEKFELELALRNNPAKPDREQILARITDLETRLRPLRLSAEQYQNEVDQYSMIIRGMLS